MSAALSTVALVTAHGHGASRLFADYITAVGPTTYPAGGTTGFAAVVAAAVGKGTVTVIAVLDSDCGGYHPVYDVAADKLKLYYIDNNNTSDGVMIEVPNTTDLSAVTFKMTVLSK
jgi:hypothetical protein